MTKESNIKAGYWAVATQKHLKEFTAYSTNLDELDELNIAGKSGRFLGAIRGNGKIDSMPKLVKMAGYVGINKSELHKIILPAIEKAADQQVELIRDSSGEITGIAEFLFTNNNVLEIAGEVFEKQNPTNLERIAVETMDETKRIPYLETELFDMLSKMGYKEEELMISMKLQESFKLISRLNKSKSKEAIISNEYVWGQNHHKIAMAVSSLDFGKKQSLKDLIDIIQKTQGYPLDRLVSFDQDLLLLANKVGMINPTAIKSSRGIKKEFAFSPNMLEPLTYRDDILDDVKLMLASIRFGENYTLHSTIEDSIKFLEFLIAKGNIGPHDANSTDYTMLEKKGIVRVVHTTKNRWSKYYQCNTPKTGYYLELVKKDVAEEALKVIKSPDYKLKLDAEIENFELVNTTGSFISPEAIRINYGVSPEPIQEMEDHFNRVLRDELL